MNNTHKLLVIVALAFFLFSFGCIGGANQTSSTPTGSTTGTSTDSSTSSSPSDTTPPSPPSDTSGSTMPVETTPSNDLSGLTYNQLLSRSVPIECDITSRTETGTVTMKMYYDGVSKTRVEFESSADTGRDSCQRMAVIGNVNNGVSSSASFGCISGQSYIPNCDWLMMEFNQSDVDDVEQTYTTPSGTPDYTRLPPTSYSCRPWIVDQTKFATPGRVCNFQDMMGGSMPSR